MAFHKLTKWKSIKMKLFMIFILVIVVTSCATVFFEFTSNENLFLNSVKIWESELSTAIVNDQMFLIDKILHSLKHDYVSNIRLLKNEIDYYSLPALFEQDSCIFKKEFSLNLFQNKVGTLIYCKDLKTIIGEPYKSIFFWLFLSVFSVLILLIKITTLNGYKSSIMALLTYLQGWAASSNHEDIFREMHLPNTDPISQKLIELVKLGTKSKVEIERLKNEKEKTDIMVQLASQVVHDIRSPLSALNMITSTLDEVSEDKRAIIKSSIQRINDIANDLLKKGKGGNQDISSEVGQKLKSDSLLTSAVESILSEKRVQFRNKIKIQISLDTSKAYGIFVAINESEFKRVLSNIINNAVEAIGDNVGVVNLTLEKQNNSAIIKITDNGPGIPENILEKLGKESVTFGKENSDSGNGIGVLHAKNTIESYGGSFSIQSTQGKGTTITLSLPISTTPVWFLEALNINQDETLIICDDDSSIHSLWKERFSSYPNLKILNFSTLKEIENWLSISENLNSSFKLLIDFEFSNESGDGLSLISKYNLNKKSILVTSHFEESNIIKKCISDDIKQIPKNLAGIVPIKIITESEKIDALILDDEELQERLWQFAAIQRGKKIVFLKTPDQLFQKLSTINTDTPIYIDSKLADGRKGEDIALHLNKLGYTNLYLTTGYSAEDFKHLSFLKGVIGKTPKFE